ncbi:MAG: phospholipid carrier-dependent glycosyltransferase [Terriglobales bacterium]
MKTALTTVALGLASLAFFLAGISNPPTTYYDEALYVSSAKALLGNAPDPTPEVPPLGKVLIACGIEVFGDNALGWRSASALFGALTLAGTFLWASLLLQDYALALTAALLTLLNNFLFVMSRVAMMDIFLVAFLIWGLVGFTAALELDELTKGERRGLLAFASAMFGLACASKWNGVDTLGIIILLTTLLWSGLWSATPKITAYRTNLQQIGMPALLLSLFVLPVIAYSLTYWPLCRSAHRPFGIGELVARNVFIWRVHRALPGNPAISSAWYSWPLQMAPQRALSYLVGNWFIMWGGLVALAICARRFWSSLPETLLILLYAANMLQWALTPQNRLYYYYYFPAAILLGVAIPLAIQQLPVRIAGIRVISVALLPAACVFLFCFAKMAHLAAPFDSALGYWP